MTPYVNQQYIINTTLGVLHQKYVNMSYFYLHKIFLDKIKYGKL